MRIYKCDHRGERRVGYEGELIANDGTCITLRARWTLQIGRASCRERVLIGV